MLLIRGSHSLPADTRQNAPQRASKSGCVCQKPGSSPHPSYAPSHVPVHFPLNTSQPLLTSRVQEMDAITCNEPKRTFSKRNQHWFFFFSFHVHLDGEAFTGRQGRERGLNPGSLRQDIHSLWKFMYARNRHSHARFTRVW